VALSTDCGFKVIKTNVDDMSHDVYSHDRITAGDDITLEVDRTLGTCPTSPLCATCTQLDLVHVFVGALRQHYTDIVK